MSLLDDMNKTAAVVRRGPIRRPLVCPHCGSHKGRSGVVKFYACADCGWEYESLAELRTVEP